MNGTIALDRYTPSPVPSTDPHLNPHPKPAPAGVVVNAVRRSVKLRAARACQRIFSGLGGAAIPPTRTRGGELHNSSLASFNGVLHFPILELYCRAPIGSSFELDRYVGTVFCMSRFLVVVRIPELSLRLLVAALLYSTCHTSNSCTTARRI